jgi:uroporphyrinogen decarboxylase
MTSRSRVLAALNHQETDRVPIDLAGHRASAIEPVAYQRLRAYLGLEPRPLRVYSTIMQLVAVHDDVLDRFDIDTIELGRGFALDDEDWVPWVLPDGSSCEVPAWAVPEAADGGWVLRSKSGRIVGKKPEGTPYFEACYWPFFEGEPNHEALEEAMSEVMWSIPHPPGQLQGPEGDRLLAEGAKRLRESTDRAILGEFGGALMEWGQFLYRIDNFLAMLGEQPDRAHDLLERLTSLFEAQLEHYLSLVGPYIDVIVFFDDMCMQTGPQISPKMYREFFKERHARLWKRAKELADVKVLLHECGSFRALLPDMIEAGLDAINPVQISCKGMDAAGLKRDFGADVTFWGGGCDTQWVLPHATPGEVSEHVKEQVEILRPGGGFVFQQVHNILADVPPGNIVAMFDAARGV